MLPPHDDVNGQWSTEEAEHATQAARDLLGRENIAHHLHLTVGDPALEVRTLAAQTACDLSSQRGAGDAGALKPVNSFKKINGVSLMELLAPAKQSCRELPRRPRKQLNSGLRNYQDFGMNSQYPPVGSKWKEVDLRVSRTVRVVRHDLAKGRVRINCIETDRLTWAKLERFNGKSGGYAPAP